jgi:hypothetical protein
MRICTSTQTVSPSRTGFTTCCTARMRSARPCRRLCVCHLVYECCLQQLLGALAVGCTGAVGSTYNYMGATYIRLMDAFKRGDMVASLEEQRKSQLGVNLLASTKYGDGVNVGKAILGLKVGSCIRIPVGCCCHEYWGPSANRRAFPLALRGCLNSQCPQKGKPCYWRILLSSVSSGGNNTINVLPALGV